ncbi:terminase large subunit domain-containing protein [Actinocrispum wychmicini]|uniref:Phage terminase large subunit-like protein n=1 Tax=Actinocrispum wychmicini TaxID=1213861 RepID=A0A4R2JDW1_9PSEU|nr:terminase family protein [Actinocrispum wychmicini]TCO57134.1 phage terminase large subunit-like protein [Actinocrispum wychmicini]
MDALTLAAQMLEDQAHRGDPVENARAFWREHGRPEQHTPSGAWNVWLILAGRGFGKTRTGAEDLADHMTAEPGSRCAIVAPTFADARDTCVEGESGLLAVLERYGLEQDKGLRWNRSEGLLKLDNGSQAKLFSAEKPARLRGPQHHRAWVDELAQVVKDAPDAWDMLLFGLRLGQHPRVVATTTPLPVSVIKELVQRQDRDVVLTRGSTYDNAVNLAGPALEQFRERYEGTRLGRQELYAELLDDVPGALWMRSWLDDHRVQRCPELTRTVVAVDPAVTSGEDADETGIVVAGQGVDGRYYVLADRSVRTTPLDWAGRVVAAFDDFEANEVVIETNQGGDALATLLRQIRPNLPIRQVHAKKGKRVRAEPVSALYEQGKVSHVGSLPQVEDQLCTWVPEQVESPDRMDALVYSLLYLSTGGSAQAFLEALAGRR